MYPKYSRLLAPILSAALLGVVTGCGGGSGSGISNIASIPAVTGGVQGGTTGVELSSGAKALATTGVQLASWPSSWSGKSQAMCMTGNALNQFYSSGAQVDNTRCILGWMEQNGKFAAGTNLYDGNAHDFTLSLNGTPMGNVRFVIAKSGSGISNFTMYSCSSISGSLTQTEYLNYNLANANSASVTSVFVGPPTSGLTFGSSVTISGALSGSTWTSKTAAAQSYNSYSFGGVTGSYAVASSITQNASGWTLASSSAGANGLSGFTPTGCSGTPAKSVFTNNLYVVADGLNLSTPATAAVGDGAAALTSSWGYQNNAGTTLTGGQCATTGAATKQVSSWLGDTQAVTTSNADTAGAQAGSLQTLTLPSSAITLSASQQWTCTSTNMAKIDLSTADVASAQAGCNTASYNWVDCSQGGL